MSLHSSLEERREREKENLILNTFFGEDLASYIFWKKNVSTYKTGGANNPAAMLTNSAGETTSHIQGK